MENSATPKLSLAFYTIFPSLPPLPPGKGGAFESILYVKVSSFSSKKHEFLY
jgi:hypothetical protein